MISKRIQLVCYFDETVHHKKYFLGTSGYSAINADVKQGKNGKR